MSNYSVGSVSNFSANVFVNTLVNFASVSLLILSVGCLPWNNIWPFSSFRINSSDSVVGTFSNAPCSYTQFKTSKYFGRSLSSSKLSFASYNFMFLTLSYWYKFIYISVGSSAIYLLTSNVLNLCLLSSTDLFICASMRSYKCYPNPAPK